MSNEHAKAIHAFAITDVTGDAHGEDDDQLALLIAERATAHAEIDHNKPVRYCPGPGWPVYLVRSPREFDRLQALSHRGVAHARRN